MPPSERPTGVAGGHVDPETLALAALGEPLGAPGQDHLAGCTECAAELASLRRVVETVRGDDAPRLAPPPSVWAGVAAATGVSVAARQDRVEASARPAESPSERAPSREAPSGGAPSAVAAALDVSSAASPPAPVPRQGALGSRLLLAVAAAAGVGALAGAAGWAAVSGGGDPAPPAAAGQVVEQAVLEPLAGVGTGEAHLVEVGDHRTLRVHVSGLEPPPGGYHEVWLLDRQAQRMVTLGVLAGDEADLVLPPGLDVGDFAVVDVSVEPQDGDPTHSGRSLLRGTLGA